jgi:hypothetical protein
MAAYGAGLGLLLARRARTLLGLILLAGAATSVALIAIQPTVGARSARFRPRRRLRC